MFVSNLFAHSLEIENGLNYIYSTQNPDGSWGSNGTSTDIVPATVSVMQTLEVLGKTDSSDYSEAVLWLENQSLETNDYLSQRISTLSVSNTDLDMLLLYRDETSAAWGGYKDFDVNNLDTALALSAISTIDFSDYNVIAGALNYLIENQNLDGGWGFQSGDESNIYMTAIILNSLCKFKDSYSLETPIKSAADYLIANQNIDGGFGLEPGVYETSLAFLALVASNENILSIASSIKNFILSKQLVNGSWNDDPYETALALRALSGIKPDLSISEISFSPIMPLPDETVTINAIIHNNGLEQAVDISVRFFDEESPSNIIEQVIPSIDPGAFIQVSANTSFSEIGGKTIVVQVDPLSTISEINETDNQISSRVWVATKPDLAIFSENLICSTQAPIPDAPFVIEYTIQNIGETDAGSFVVSLYDGDPAQGGVVLENINLSGLAGASSRTGSFAVSLNQTGMHKLYIIADYENQISELSDDNNGASVLIQVDDTGQIPDFSITYGDIIWAPSNPLPGDTVELSAIIRNYGLGSAENVIVEFFDGSPESGGTLIYKQLLSLDAGGAQSVTVQDWVISEGIHDIYIIIDRENVVVEMNETNNQVSFRIMTDMVDILVSTADLTFNPAYPVAGDDVALEIDIHNMGISETGPFSTAIYDGDPDADGILLQRFQINTIPGSNTETIFYNFTAEARTYRFYVKADYEKQVTELSEFNNQAIRSIVIKGQGETYGPDLVPIKFEILEDSTTTITNTLEINGDVQITFQNKGDEKIEQEFDLLIFEDTNLDGRYTDGVDTALGAETNSVSLWPKGVNAVNIAISGKIRFLNAPISALIDSTDNIMEPDEDNNIIVTGRDCEVRPVDPIQPVMEWNWKKQRFFVVVPPVVANVTDDNGDGVINDKDTPAIVFGLFGGYGGNEPSLVALRGDTGEQIFSNTDYMVSLMPFTAAQQF